jgi:hypothetical protein
MCVLEQETNMCFCNQKGSSDEDYMLHANESNVEKDVIDDRQKRCKTYSSRDSHVVTHRSTNLPFNCLCMAERTGCPVFS